MSFYNTIKEICEKNNKVALFIDMDGTIAEYTVFDDNYITTETRGVFINSKPLNIVIENLGKLSKIKNLDLYILSLSRSKIIIEEKKKWLKKYAPFIKEENYIILCREKGEYNSENKEVVKSEKMKEKLNNYDFVILVDDEHKILRRAKKELKDRGAVFHPSSVIV